MSEHVVYYRKYRPQTFSAVVGQDHIVRILQAAIAKERIAHAYLFSGPRGTGKTTIARILAREAGCDSDDVVEIDAASSRGIDEARALREAARFVPLKSKKKCYIIDEVHMLTKEAFNALLKTLEEPPAHAIFILATTELYKVPDTIVSRTQHFTFRKIPIPVITKELKRIASVELLDAEDDALKLIAFLADGSLRDAENLLLQAVSTIGKHVLEKDVRLLLGAPPEETTEYIIRALAEQKPENVLSALDASLKEGTDPDLLGKLLLRSIRAIYFLALDPKTSLLLENEFSSEEIVILKVLLALRPNSLFWERAMRELLQALTMRVDDYISHIPLELALVTIAVSQK